MVSTGIVRRVDDLGRVVIPKEIRKAKGINAGDPLEIFTDKDNNIILKKYVPDNIDELINYTIPDVIYILEGSQNPPYAIIENLQKILKYNNEEVI